MVPVKRIALVLLTFLATGELYPQVSNPSDSLENRLREDIKDEERVTTLSRLSLAYLKYKKIGAAGQKLAEAEELVKSQGIDIPYMLHWARAEHLYLKRDAAASVAEIEIAIKKIYQTGDNLELGKAYNARAAFLHYSGKFMESIEAYQANIEFATANHLRGIIPVAYRGLFYVYRSAGNTEEMRKVSLQMADAAQREGDLRTTAEAWLMVGDIGMEFDSSFVYAIQQYRKSLDLYHQLNDTTRIAFLLLRIAWNQYLNKEIDSALVTFFRSLDYSLPGNRLTSITNAYGNIGTIYRDKKDFPRAIKYYKASIDYSYKARDWYNLSWLYLDMSHMYASLGQYQEAYENHVLYKQFSDSVEMNKYTAGLSEARTAFEADTAKKELELVTLKLKQHTFFTYAFAGLILLIIIIGVLILHQNRIKARQRISEMNHKISEITQKNLRQQMNPHFIFNTLNSIQYYMYQHDKISTNNYLTKFSMLMRKTLENSQHTAIPVKDELDALQLYLELEALRFKEKFEYKIIVDDDIDPMIHKIPTMLIQPYVENAICHGLMHRETKGKLIVDLKLDQDKILCTIEDNGIGREAAAGIRKARNGAHNSLGTKITESRINLVNELYGKDLKVEYTDLKNEPGEPTGTRVVIQVPVMI